MLILQSVGVEIELLCLSHYMHFVCPDKNTEWLHVALYTAWFQARCLENENHGVLKKIIEGSLRLGRLEEKVKVSSVSKLNIYCEMFGFF